MKYYWIKINDLYFTGVSQVSEWYPSDRARDAREVSSIAGSGRFPGVGNGNALQYS